MIRVFAPPGSAAEDMLRISHDGPEFVVTVPTGVRPGQPFLVNIPRT